MQGHWGFNSIGNETYFLEQGLAKDEWCPFTNPKFVDCPHRTIGEAIQTIYNLEPSIYALDGEYKLPENIKLNVPNSNKFYYIGMETLKYIKPLMTQTNYYPIVITGFKIDSKSFAFLDKLVNEVNKIGRSIVLENSSDYVLPNYVKYERNKK